MKTKYKMSEYVIVLDLIVGGAYNVVSLIDDLYTSEHHKLAGKIGKINAIAISGERFKLDIGGDLEWNYKMVRPLGDSIEKLKEFLKC